MTWGQITDEAIEEARTMVGVPLRRDRSGWVTEVTSDAIAHYTEGTGDANPLWRDETYGLGTQWQSRLAPPSFLYAVDLGVIAPKLPGVQWIGAGTDWTWYDVVRLRDTFDVDARLESVDEKSGEFARRWVMQNGRVTYRRRTTADLVAVARTHIARTPRGGALASEGTKKYRTTEPYKYSSEQLQEIERQALSERARGADTLFWEDVEVGHTLDPLVRGPLTTTDLIAYYAGACGVRHYGGAHGDAVRYRLRHQDFRISERTGTPDTPGAGHIEADVGKDVGMGGAYDIAPARISWGITAVTNWMGDDGFLHVFNVRLLRPNVVGNTTWWHADVTGKDATDGKCAVHLQLRAVTQLGDTIAEATAVVLLPSRLHGPVTLPLDPA